MGFHKDGVMVKFTWVKGLIPEKLPVKQVYGIAFSDDNRVILRIEERATEENWCRRAELKSI